MASNTTPIEAPILVLKFGGTSVAGPAEIRRVADIIRDAGRDGGRPVVVTSAMSKVTDGLIDSVRRAVAGHVDGSLDVLDRLLERHRETAQELLGPENGNRFEAVVNEAAGNLVDLLRVLSRHPGTRRALEDEIVAHGEHLSSWLLALTLRERGLPAVWVDARNVIRTDDRHGRANPLPDAIRVAAVEFVEPHIAAGEIPVLGGFVGSGPQGATTTLGRGGSDFSGALAGAALRAAEVQIWTDVSGFLTADPRVVPGARAIPHLSYAEAAELAYFGAKVLHPRTILPAVELSLPVRICNSRQPGGIGTRIDGRREVSAQGVKAIVHKRGIMVVQVTAARMLGAYGFLRALFEKFERHQTSVDIVTTSEVSVSLTIDDASALPQIVAELGELGEVTAEDGYAIVCAVGEGLRQAPGIAGRVFGALGSTNTVMISQGASTTNLTFVVRDEDVEDVVTRLHDRFFGAPSSNADLLKQ